MAGARALVAILAAVLVLLAASSTRAQEPEEPLEITVVERMTLLNAGQPVQGARLAFANEGQGPIELAADAVATDGTGVATLPAAPRTRRLVVWKPGFATSVYLVRGGGARRLSLDPAKSLSVTVRTPDGKRAPGSDVRVSVALPINGAPDPDLDVHGFELGGIADEQGEVLIGGLVAEGLSVRAELEGWLGAERFPVSTRDEAIDLVLRRGSDVAGRVVDERTGEAVRGGLVRLAGIEATLDEDGAFRIERVPPGVQTLTVEGADFLAPRERVLHLREGRDRLDLEIRVVRTASVTGTVLLTSAEGSSPELPSARPMELTFIWPPGAAAGDRRTPPEPRTETVRLDPGGGFLVRGLLPAAGVVLVARREGFVPVVREGLNLRSGETLEGVWIEMDAGGRMRGSVVDPEGAAVAEAVVEARLDGAEPPLVVATSATDARGAFELSGLPAGGVLLRVVPPVGSGAVPLDAGPFDVVRGQESEAGLLRLSPGLVLRGFVRGGHPADARVVAEQGGRTLGPFPIEVAGFEIRGLFPGRALVRMESDTPGASPPTEVALPAGGSLTLTWTPNRSVVVDLVDGLGAAVREAELTFRAVEQATESDLPLPGPERTVAFRSSTGRASFDLAVGRHDLHARAPDGAAGRASVVVPPPTSGGASPVVRVVLESGELLRGSVAAADDGLPVEGARVTLERETGSHDGGAVYTDETGRFAFSGVGEGVVRVRVEAPGFVPLLGDAVLVRRGGTPLLEQLALRRGAVLRGRLLSRRGAVRPGTLVRVTSDAGPYHELATDLYGRFEVDGLPAGGVTIEVDTALHGRRSRRLDMPYSGEVEEVLELDGGTRLFGVVRSSGRPEPFARVRLFGAFDPDDPVSGHAVETRADAYGRYELPPVPSGPAEVSVEIPDSTVVHTFEIDVPDMLDDLLDLDLPEAWIAGQVVAETGGEPQSGAFVRLYEPDPAVRILVAEAVSDGTGSFRLERVPAGTYVLEASRSGFGARIASGFVVEEGAGRGGLLLSLPDEAVVQARVLDRERRPLPDGWFLAEPHGDGAPRTSRRVTADPAGRIRLTRLPPGAWTLSAGAPGRGSRNLGVLDLAAGMLDLGEIHLDPESALRISVVENGLFPASGVEVDVRDLFGRDPRTPRTDLGWAGGFDGRYVTNAEGRVLVTGLAAGAYEIQIAGRPDTLATVRVGTEEIASAYLFHTPAPAAAPEEPVHETPGDGSGTEDATDDR